MKKQQLVFEVSFVNHKKNDYDLATIKADSIKDAKGKVRERYANKKIRISRMTIQRAYLAW